MLSEDVHKTEVKNADGPSTINDAVGQGQLWHYGLPSRSVHGKIERNKQITKLMTYEVIAYQGNTTKNNACCASLRMLISGGPFWLIFDVRSISVWMCLIYTMWGPRSIAKLVNITPMSLWFMVLITIVTGAYKPTYNWGGLTLRAYNGVALVDPNVCQMTLEEWRAIIPDSACSCQLFPPFPKRATAATGARSKQWRNPL